MVHGWMRMIFKRLVSRREQKKGRHPPASLRYMISGLHAETGRRKFYAGKVFEWHKHPRSNRMLSLATCISEYVSKYLEKIFNICIKRSSKYVGAFWSLQKPPKYPCTELFWRLRSERNHWKWQWQEISQQPFSDQNRQDAISRVSDVRNSPRGPRWEHWRSGGWNTQSHQQCRLRRNGNNSYGCPTSPGGTCMAACTLHKSQKASSSLSRLTKKVTWARCGDEKSF